MKGALDLLDALQEFLLRSRECDSRARRSSSAECGTSTHDLTAYVWGTDGSLEEDLARQPLPGAAAPGPDKARTGWGRRPSARRGRPEGAAEAERVTCDASTSTFDLSAYVWGIAGCEDWTDPVSDGVHGDDSRPEFSGDIDRSGRALPEGSRKRSRAAAVGSGVSSGSGDFGALPQNRRVSKRRV